VKKKSKKKKTLSSPLKPFSTAIGKLRKKKKRKKKKEKKTHKGVVSEQDGL